jgi:hypothetical protein
MIEVASLRYGVIFILVTTRRRGNAVKTRQRPTVLVGYHRPY